MLSVLRHCWAPEAFVVSFKLETDESILLEKVRNCPDSSMSNLQAYKYLS